MVSQQSLTSTVTQQASPPVVPPATIDSWIGTIMHSSSRTVQAVLCFGIGVLAGTLCRRYLMIVFWWILSTLFFIKWAEYHHLLTVDWTGCTQFMLGSSQINIDALFGALFVCIKDNLINTGALILGFLVGYKQNQYRKGPIQGVNIKMTK